MQAVLDQARAVAEPIRSEIRRTQLALRDAVKADSDLADLGSLHARIGEAHARLVAVQSAGFAAGLQLLSDEQKPDAKVLFDVLGLIVAPSQRPLALQSNAVMWDECPTNPPALAPASSKPATAD